MIEVADANATYYYHFDALGSVVALSDAAGDTVQTYEYSVYGEVAVEDANHTNPYMFAGVRYDIEIGLYYNRARYYNPFTGRFLQTDPVGYGAGMNLYMYCANNPVAYTDPSGLLWGVDIHAEGGYLQFGWYDLKDYSERDLEEFGDTYDFIVDGNESQRELLEIALQDIFNLDTGKELMEEIVGYGVKIVVQTDVPYGGLYTYEDQTIYWKANTNAGQAPSFMALAHEMIHAYLDKEDIVEPASTRVTDTSTIAYQEWKAKNEARVDGVLVNLSYPNGEVVPFDYRGARFTMNQLRWEAGYLPPIANRTVPIYPPVIWPEV